MDLSFYKTYFEAEKNHWWFKVRRNIVLSILKKYNISKTAKIFDFGCGSGYTVSFLQSEGYNAHGSDVSNEAIEYGKCLITGATTTYIGQTTYTGQTNQIFTYNG